jgi:hypothetical protein
MDGEMYTAEGFGMAFGMIFWMFMLGFYLFFAYTQYRIATKCGHENAWFAFVPIINVVQLVQMAGKSLWWLLLLLVPLVNIVCAAILYMNIADRCGHSKVIGFLTIFPLINFITLCVMAFSGPNQPNKFQTPSRPTSPRQPVRV